MKEEGKEKEGRKSRKVEWETEMRKGKERKEIRGIIGVTGKGRDR